MILVEFDVTQHNLYESIDVVVIHEHVYVLVCAYMCVCMEKVDPRNPQS